MATALAVVVTIGGSLAGPAAGAPTPVTAAHVSSLNVALDCALPATSTPPAGAGSSRHPLSFGVTDSHPTRATLPLLRTLQGRLRRLGVHDYTGPTRSAAYLRTVYPRLHRLSRRGYPVTLDVGIGNTNGAAPSRRRFVRFVRHVVRHDGGWLYAIEITNEPDVPSPTTSDGANTAVIGDLVDGVVAAKSLVRRLHLRLRVGFNVAYDYGADSIFWARLALQATPEFRRDVDWVGLHTYPNLLSADTPVNGSVEVLERLAMATTRSCLAAIGLSPAVPIEVTEVGYPTTRGPTEYAAQRDYWQRVIATVAHDGPAYGVGGLFIFLLQDAPATAAVASGYGVFDQHGHSKPARRLLTRLFQRYGRTVPRWSATRELLSPNPS